MLLQHLPEIRDLNPNVVLGSVFLLFAWAVAALVALVLVNHHPEWWGGGGTQREANVWTDEKLANKIIRMAEKFDFVERKLNGKRNQKLLENMDKNERKSAQAACLYFLMTWIPTNFILLAFDRMYRLIRLMLSAPTALVRRLSGELDGAVERMLLPFLRSRRRR